MVGHLLEHNGIIGPFYADKNGCDVDFDDPNACRFCMAGAIDKVTQVLNFKTVKPGLKYGSELTSAIEHYLGPNEYNFCRVSIWEGKSKNERLKLARHLQKCGLE